MINLMIQQHNKTGLKYFHKSATRTSDEYKGSGKYWKRHLAKHGNDVTTIWSGSFHEDEVEEFALFVSEELDIVNSAGWANIIPENGLDGAPAGNVLSEETKNKISKSLTGKPNPKTKYEMKESSEERGRRSRMIHTGRIGVTNGYQDRRVYPDQIPEGFWKGTSNRTGDKNFGRHNKSGDNTRGRKIFNNGEKHKYFFVGQEPEGWVRGKMEGFQGGTGALKKGKKYS
jgi:hypothetical protein